MGEDNRRPRDGYRGVRLRHNTDEAGERKRTLGREGRSEAVQ